jgi:hypothetical protein
VIYAGAGIRLRKNASARALRTTIGPVIDDPRYRAAAQHMAARLASEREDNRAIDELEQVAARGPATGKRTARPPAPFPSLWELAGHLCCVRCVVRETCYGSSRQVSTCSAPDVKS